MRLFHKSCCRHPTMNKNIPHWDIMLFFCFCVESNVQEGQDGYPWSKIYRFINIFIFLLIPNGYSKQGLFLVSFSSEMHCFTYPAPFLFLLMRYIVVMSSLSYVFWCNMVFLCKFFAFIVRVQYFVNMIILVSIAYITNCWWFSMSYLCMNIVELSN